MRIGVDFRLASRHFGGMSVYLKNLIALLKTKDPENTYILFDDNPKGKKGFAKNAWTLIWEQLWLQIYLPYSFIVKKIDFAYFPNPPVSFFLTVPLILTIPDVSFVFDSSLPTFIKWYLKVNYYLSAHKATRITTFSQSSKQDIVKIFRIHPEKISVIPLAASEEIKPMKISDKPGAKYVLAVPGTFVARKNIEETVLAFKALPQKTSQGYVLKVVGHAQGENYERLKSFIENEGMTRKVFFTGRVDNLELSNLYSHASAFVCSSLYEGFGLPVLEAMKCGVPVISYNNSSLPEVVGDAGILVNNVSELTNALNQILENKTLHDKLKEQGIRRAASYSWTKATSDFMRVLHSYDR